MGALAGAAIGGLGGVSRFNQSIASNLTALRDFFLVLRSLSEQLEALLIRKSREQE